MPIRAEIRPLYRSPEWAFVRTAVFARACYRCEECGRVSGSTYENRDTGRTVKVQLGCAHLDHEDLARFYDPKNLRCRCRACHLRADVPVHAVHRAVRKDRARPLLAEAEGVRV